jgi:hypothetical protein
MMSLALDFALPSCPGIPDSMWIAVSSMITVVTKRCWSLLGAFITIRLLVDAIFDVSQGQFTLVPYARTLLHAFFIASFLTYYKPLLVFFDGFIESLCNVEEIVFSEALFNQGKDRITDYFEDKSFFSWVDIIVKNLVELLPKTLFLLTHSGAIHAMHYLKAVTLLIITCVGPFAAVFSILPGPFKKGWPVWAHSYVHVTCWTITLNIFMALTKAFNFGSLMTEPRSGSTFFSEIIGQAVLSFVLLIAIFLTPTWTSKFMGPAVIAPLGSILNQILTRVGTSVVSRIAPGPNHSKK